MGRNDSETSVLITGLIVGLIFGITTSGRAILNLKNKNLFVSFPNYVLMNVLMIILSSSVGVLAGCFTFTTIGKMVAPSFEGVRDNLWSSFLLLIIAGYIYKSYKNLNIDIHDKLYKRAAMNISSKTANFIRVKCVELNADYYLTLAICMCESLQRPSWFRRLERLKGLLFRSGTSGIMQIQSEYPTDDETSIVTGVKEYLAGKKITSEEDLFRVVEKYNPSKNFQEMVIHFYSRLIQEKM